MQPVILILSPHSWELQGVLDTDFCCQGNAGRNQRALHSRGNPPPPLFNSLLRKENVRAERL